MDCRGGRCETTQWLGLSSVPSTIICGKKTCGYADLTRPSPMSRWPLVGGGPGGGPGGGGGGAGGGKGGSEGVGSSEPGTECGLKVVGLHLENLEKGECHD